MGPSIAPFQIWEIPIICAFFIFGISTGVSVAFLNMIIRLAFFQGRTSFFGPFWTLLPTLCMLLGVLVAGKILERRVHRVKGPMKNSILYYTSTALAFRTIIMPFIDYFIYLYILPIILGRAISVTFVLSIMPLIMVFNIITTLYTIPTAYFISKRVNKNLKVSDLSSQIDPGTIV